MRRLRGSPFAGGRVAGARMSRLCRSVTMGGKRFTLRRADLFACRLAEGRNVTQTIIGFSTCVVGVGELQ